MRMIKLSVIIPAYNAEPYLSELLDCLSPQMTKETECIVIDDGSRAAVHTAHKWCKVYRQDNAGVSVARNKGIDKAKGEYISFIDADDLVPEYYVQKILEMTKDEPDVIELSWKSLTDKQWNLDMKLSSDQDRLPNPSVCTRVFKRVFIGDNRFNTKKDSTEDEDFARKIGYLDPDNIFKRAVIKDYMYYYRDDVTMSKTKKYAAGLMNTKKVVHFYNHVSKDMMWLLDEIKKEDETNEVWLMTFQNDIPELKRYCQVVKPREDWGHIVRGESCPYLTHRKPPIKTQVVIYRRHINDVGGLITFTLNFIEALGDKYDITILAETVAKPRLMQLLPKVRVITGKEHIPIVCDSLIILSFLDHMPKGVSAGKVIRMCHACKTDPSWKIPQDYDELLYVSKTAADSFDDPDGKVLHNINLTKARDTLMLVSAIRLPAEDKGHIEERMRKLADMLNAADIPFIWLNYSSGGIQNPPKNFYNMGVTHDMQSILKLATYNVLLSDSECWSYSCLESLMVGTPMICTPFPSAFEMGVKDGVNAHVIPFDMDFDVRVLLDVPQFTYKYDNDKVIKDWIEVLGHTTPKHDYDPGEVVMTRVLSDYHDMLLDEDLTKGMEVAMTLHRAEQVEEAGYIEIIGGA